MFSILDSADTMSGLICGLTFEHKPRIAEISNNNVGIFPIIESSINGITDSKTPSLIFKIPTKDITKGIKAIKVDNERLEEIQSFISEGAMAFLFREYKTLGIFVVVLFPILGFLVSWWTAICFIFGALFSALAGFIGMKAATAANAKTAYSAQKGGMGAALAVAFSGGAIMGLCVVGLGLGGVS